MQNLWLAFKFKSEAQHLSSISYYTLNGETALLRTDVFHALLPALSLLVVA